jgi:hypothetical protein
VSITIQEKVFLIAAPPSLISEAAAVFADQGGKQVRPFALLLPWRGTFGELRLQLHSTNSELSSVSVIAELNGGDFFA